MLLQTCVINICIQTDLVYFDPLVVYLPSLIFREIVQIEQLM